MLLTRVALAAAPAFGAGCRGAATAERAGPRACGDPFGDGGRLDPLVRHEVFLFAWSAFVPDADLYRPSE